MANLTLDKPRNGTGYPDQIARSGLELAATIGIRPAARELGISTTTIIKWQRRFPQHWSDLRAGKMEAFQQGFASRLEDLADRYAEDEHKALDRAETLIPVSDPKETAALIRAMAAGRGIATAGARAARGEPGSISQLNINFADLEQAIDALVNAPAQPVEISEAEVVEDA